MWCFLLTHVWITKKHLKENHWFGSERHFSSDIFQQQCFRVSLMASGPWVIPLTACCASPLKGPAPKARWSKPLTLTSFCLSLLIAALIDKWPKALPLTAWNLSNAWVWMPTRVIMRVVASDLVLDGGCHRALKLPSSLTTGLSQLSHNMAEKETKNEIPKNMLFSEWYHQIVQSFMGLLQK